MKNNALKFNPFFILKFDNPTKKSRGLILCVEVNQYLKKNLFLFTKFFNAFFFQLLFFVSKSDGQKKEIFIKRNKK